MPGRKTRRGDAVARLRVPAHDASRQGADEPGAEKTRWTDPASTGIGSKGSEGQSDLFGTPEPKPARRRAGRPRQEPEAAPEEPAPSAPVELTIDALAERLTTADLDALVSALPEEALSHIVVAGLRQLRRRYGRRASQGSRGAKGRSASALESIAREVAAVLGGTGEEF